MSLSMADVLLLKGPCDPRRADMVVTVDATEVSIRPEPFDWHDVYRVVDRRVDGDTVAEATGEYLHTVGSRSQIEAYRKALERLGTGQTFKVKRGG
jgi:hypothetical protein